MCSSEFVKQIVECLSLNSRKGIFADLHINRLQLFIAKWVSSLHNEAFFKENWCINSKLASCKIKDTILGTWRAVVTTILNIFRDIWFNAFICPLCEELFEVCWSNYLSHTTQSINVRQSSISINCSKDVPARFKFMSLSDKLSILRLSFEIQHLNKGSSGWNHNSASSKSSSRGF